MIESQYIRTVSVNQFECEINYYIRDVYNPNQYVDELNKVYELTKLAGEFSYSHKFRGSYFQSKTILKKIEKINKKFCNEKDRILKENEYKRNVLRNILSI